MVHAKQVQDGGVEVIVMIAVFCRLLAVLVCVSVFDAPLIST
ncbi:MAG: hypothetical protein RLZZ458_1530, partial [Planctomycetota bacterium]